MGNYYNNDVVQGWLEEYLNYPLEVRKVDKKALLLRERILAEVAKIVNGEIFTHRFTMWENYDDLFQEAMEACIKAMEKFNPNYITSKGIKATSFNYFSLTTKRCLKFYTIRNKKFRNNPQIEDFIENITVSRNMTENSVKVASDMFICQLKELLKDQKNQKFHPLIEVLENYLNHMGSYNKRDFFRFAKSYGWSPNLIRRFLKIIKDNKDLFYKDYDESINVEIDSSIRCYDFNEDF